MKKTLLKNIQYVYLLSLMFITSFSFGQSAGFNTTYIVLSVNGGSNTYYDLQATTGNPDFNGTNLGTFCEGTSGIVFKGAEHNNYKCGGCDITSTRINYSVYLTSGPQATFADRNIGFDSDFANGCGGRDQKWSSVSYNEDLTSTLPPGNYTFEVYSDQSTTCSGTQYASNGGANYKAYFIINPNVTYYADADSDGFGDMNVAQVSCSTIPMGYLVNSLDCDDTKAAVHPGATEVCYDGIDNNCDGTIDNGCVPKITTVQTSQCGATLNSINENIYANLVSGAQAYRFKVTNLITNQVQTIDRALRVFAVTQLPSYAFDTPYQVEVAVKYNNVWQPFYGTPCTVSTPATTTQIQTSQCASTLDAMTDIIYANNVPFATGYRFRITNTVTNQAVVLDRLLREFRMNLLSEPFYETDYTVEVAIRNTDGFYLPFGTPCLIRTPDFPLTSLTEAYCGNTSDFQSGNIYTNSVSGASLYRFLITDNDSFYYTVDKVLPVINLSSIPDLPPCSILQVSISIKIGSVFGPFGSACTILSYGDCPTRLSNTTKTSNQEFAAFATPNPFSDTFKIALSTPSKENVTIKVYNMLGALVEEKKVTPNDMENFQIGQEYQSGVYNIIINQADNSKSLRVIKR